MLTDAQYLTLKVAALADSTAATYITNAQDQALSDWLNTPEPVFYCWRTRLDPRESRTAVVIGATQLDALTGGKRDSLFWLLSDTINPTNIAVRAAIDDLCGSQNTLKTALQAALKRTVNRAEKILSSGVGTSGSPAILGWEGSFDATLASLVRVAQ